MMAERHGVEIDYCPKCRGVWLDRGELDKIIERAAALEAPAQPSAPVAPAYPPPRAPVAPYGRSRDDDDDDDDWGRRRKKKGGFLGELFDF